MTTTLDALRRELNTLPEQTDRGERDGRNDANVRVLLSRTMHYNVKSSLFSEVLAQTIRIEALRHSPAQTAAWLLAMFDARCLMGSWPVNGIEDFAQRVQSAVVAAGPSREDLSRAVHGVVQSVYGQQMRVTGWLPGFRIMESKELLVVTGDACPACAVNPLVRERNKTIACLNSEECGWVKD